MLARRGEKVAAYLSTKALVARHFPTCLRPWMGFSTNCWSGEAKRRRSGPCPIRKSDLSARVRGAEAIWNRLLGVADIGLAICSQVLDLDIGSLGDAGTGNRSV